MQIRRKTFRRLIGDKSCVKALALLYYVKHHHKSSTITKFSYNKLRLLTGLHITTLRKYVKTLHNLGLVAFIGKHQQNLLFKGDYSGDKRKNVNLDALVYDSVKDVAASLYAMYVVEEQRRKDYVKRVILISTEEEVPEGVTYEEIIEASKIRNRNCYGNVYNETGISYNRLAKRLGMFSQKAVSIIKFACKHGFILKWTHKVWEQCDDAFLRVRLGIDYVSAKVVGKLDNCGNIVNTVFGLRVKANSYEVGDRFEGVSPLTIPHGIVIVSEN